jgi:hypothetical protein
MRALFVLVAVLTVVAANIIDIPRRCEDPEVKAKIVSVWGMCNNQAKSVDDDCNVKGCDGVSADQISPACPERNKLKYLCDLSGKHTKKLTDDKGCFTCDYATQLVNGSELTPNERCPILSLPKCAAGVKPKRGDDGCPICRPARGVKDTSSSCSQQQISSCAQRLGDSLKYCPQSAKATIDSQCCPSCKPVCQGAPSPFALEAESSVQLTSHTAWTQMKHNIDVFVWPPNNAQFDAPTGWPSVAGGNDFLKCSGGGGFNPGGGGGGNNGGGGGGGGGNNGGGGGGGGGNGSGNNGGNSENTEDSGNTGGGSDNNGGGGEKAKCPQATIDSCQAKLASMPTCAAGVSPQYDEASCCIDCRPDNKVNPAPSAEKDIKQCSDDEVYKCQLHTRFCKDTEPQIGNAGMCCKSCRRAEDLCTPMEVANFYFNAPACPGKTNAQHLDGQCGPTCVPAKSLCTPNCKSNQLCMAQASGKQICVDAYQTELVIKFGGKQYLNDLAAMTKEAQSFYLREVASRYCEIPQVNDECLVATKSIASLEVVHSEQAADGSVKLVVLMKGDVNNNDPTSLLVSSLQRKFSTAGDSMAAGVKVVSIVSALPTESTSAAAAIIAGVAAGVVALLAVLGFFLYRRYKATGEKHAATTTHIEMATTTKA